MSVQQDGFSSSDPGSLSTKERVGGAGSTNKPSATDAKKVATDQAKTVAVEAKTQAQQLLSNTRSEVQTQAEDRSRQAAQHLRGMSTSITALLEGRPSEASQVRGYLEQAQTKIDSFAGRLESGGPQGLVDDLSSFARRRPGAFLLAAGVAGFAIGRVARAGVAAAHDDQSNSQRPMLQSGMNRPAPQPAPLQSGIGQSAQQPTTVQSGIR
jgi:hypothetical protein